MKTEPNDSITGFDTKDCGHCVGLTKREYFAAMAMQALASNQFVSEVLFKYVKQKGIYAEENVIAISAVQYADALIEALNKEVI